MTRLALFIIRLYQLTLSPYIGWHCRYQPSCSAYASEAIRIHGPLRGSWLALGRIARCRPGGGFGADPVPTNETDEIKHESETATPRS